MNKIIVTSDSEVAEALALLKGDVLAVDTETSGFDPYTCTLWCVQVGNDTDAVLFPWVAMSEESRNLLRTFFVGKTIVAHNAKFDVKFLKVNGFSISKVWCTMESEAVLSAGKYFTLGLKDVLLRRFQVQMEKETRQLFYNDAGDLPQIKKWILEEGAWSVWTNHEELCEYALDDIVYLLELMRAQQEEANLAGLHNVVWLENALVPEVASIELRGVYMDVSATKKYQNKVLIARDRLEREVNDTLTRSWNLYWQEEFSRRMKLLNAWKEGHEKVKQKASELRKTIKNDKENEEAIREKAKKMVADSNKKCPYNKLPALEEAFNINSPVKLRPALSRLVGFDIPTTKADWLEENILLHPIIEKLLEFRKYKKLAEFCELQDKVNPVTNRIHGRFNQSGTRSGRFSSSDPNLQQIPARSEEAKEFRGLFKPREGYVFVGADLAGIELVIMACLSGEEELLDAIQTGKDIHCYTMSKIMDCDYQVLFDIKEGIIGSSKEFTKARIQFEAEFRMPELLKLTEPKAWVKKFRDYVKTMTYGIAYGQTAYGASNKFHCEYEIAERLINDRFFGAYPKLRTFIKSAETIGYERGYACNDLGRRRWFTKPKKKSYEQIEAEVISRLKAEHRVWESITDHEWQDIMQKAIDIADREYKSRVNSIKRQSANYIPQSMCADMVKLAMYKYGKYQSSEREGLILTVHDELIAECEATKAEETASQLERCLQESVNKFLPDVKVKVDAKIMEKWEK